MIIFAMVYLAHEEEQQLKNKLLYMAGSLYRCATKSTHGTIVRNRNGKMYSTSKRTSNRKRRSELSGMWWPF